MTYIARQFEPHTFDIGHVCLPSQNTLRTDLKCHAGNFGCQRPQPDHHAIDSIFQVEDLATRIDINLLGQIPQGNGFGDTCDIANLVGQICGKLVDDTSELTPRAFDIEYESLTAELTVAKKSEG